MEALMPFVMNILIPDKVFDYFAADPVGPMLTFRPTLEDVDCVIRAEVNTFLESIPADALAAVRQEPWFEDSMTEGGGTDREARILLAERILSDEISRRRLRLIREQRDDPRPLPYKIPPLADLDVDSEHLVRLSDFDFDGSRLLRKGWAFTVLSTTRSPNSTYWLLNAIYSEGLANVFSVRLDPYLHGPAGSFSAMFYRMWVYGRSLDWERISHLTEPDHGRWRPGSLSREAEITEFCWDPRNNEVHFVREEVPKAGSIEVDASRYLHAVYIRDSEQLSHLDGALRLYSAQELGKRLSLHVRTSGKIAIREKVFRTDKPIPVDSFSTLSNTFFVWNQDVADYFGHALSTG